MSNSCNLNTAFIEENSADLSITDSVLNKYLLEASFTSMESSVPRYNHASDNHNIDQIFEQITDDQASPLQLLKYNENLSNENILLNTSVNTMVELNELPRATESNKFKLHCKKICGKFMKPLAKRLKKKNEINSELVKDQDLQIVEVPQKILTNNNMFLKQYVQSSSMKDHAENFGIYGDIFYCYI